MSEAAELAAKLKAEGDKFIEFFGKLSDQQWKLEIYAEGSVWTVQNILAHLATTERAFVRLFEEIRQGGAGVSEDFVIDRYNARQQEKTKDLKPEALLVQYQGTRDSMVAWVASLRDEDLVKIGRHPFLGITSLREMIKMIYIHNQTHYRDIKKIVK